MSEEQLQSFDSVKTRLDEIVQAVSDESLPLDDALGLYEEAVKLGMQASTMLEENLGLDDDQAEEGVEEEQQEAPAEEQSPQPSPLQAEEAPAENENSPV